MLWGIYRNTDRIVGVPMACFQQSVWASAEDRTLIKDTETGNHSPYIGLLGK